MVNPVHNILGKNKKLSPGTVHPDDEEDIEYFREKKTNKLFR